MERKYRIDRKSRIEDQQPNTMTAELQRRYESGSFSRLASNGFWLLPITDN
jgi:hypothetical protein